MCPYSSAYSQPYQLSLVTAVAPVELERELCHWELDALDPL